MIRTIAAIATALMFHLPAMSQDCQGPVRMVLGFGVGGGLDGVVRLLAQKYTEKFGRNAIVDNKTGAGGNIAASFVAGTPADGCTLLFTANNHTLNPLMYARAGYEVKDFAPVVRVATGPLIVVAGQSQPFKTIAAMVDYAKANPGKLSYGSAGIGSVNHVVMELFLKESGLNIVHIPYKGGALAMADTAAGTVPLTISSVAAALPFIQTDKVTALSTSGTSRWPSLPRVPSMPEAGYPKAAMTAWIGLFAPAATPLAVREKINQDFRALLLDQQVTERLQTLGYQAGANSPQELDAFVREDVQVNRVLAEVLKLKVD